MVLFKKNSPCQPWCVCPCNGEDFPSQFSVVLSGFVEKGVLTCISGACSNLNGTYVIDRDDGLCSGSIIAAVDACESDVKIEVSYTDNATAICDSDYDVFVRLTWIGPSPDQIKTYLLNSTESRGCTGFEYTLLNTFDDVVKCSNGLVKVTGVV